MLFYLIVYFPLYWLGILFSNMFGKWYWRKRMSTSLCLSVFFPFFLKRKQSWLQETNASPKTHLQFSRRAACPSCNISNNSSAGFYAIASPPASAPDSNGHLRGIFWWYLQSGWPWVALGLLVHFLVKVRVTAQPSLKQRRFTDDLMR